MFIERKGNRQGGIDVDEVTPGGSLRGGGNGLFRLLRFLTGTFRRGTKVQDIVNKDDSSQRTMEKNPEPEPNAETITIILEEHFPHVSISRSHYSKKITKRVYDTVVKKSDADKIIVRAS